MNLSVKNEANMIVMGLELLLGDFVIVDIVDGTASAEFELT